MKQLFCIFLAFLLLLPLAACGGPGKEPEAQTTAAAAGPGDPSGTAAPGPSGQTRTGDPAYHPETDFDQRIGMNGNLSTFLETEDVYYWLPQHDGYLRYCEKDGSDWGVVCGKPECVHDNGNASARDREKECNGYIGGARRFLWLQDGKLWYVNSDYLLLKAYPDAWGVLMRMDPDGTNREQVRVIPKPDMLYGENMCPQQYFYHRGMLYSYVTGGLIEGGEPSQPFLALAFPLDGEEWITVYDSGREFHSGSLMPVGDCCYIVDMAWNYADPSILEDDNYDGEVVLSRNECILLRWSAVTGELETLYRGDPSDGSDPVGSIFRYWIDGEGNFYTQEKYVDGVGSKRVLRLKDGAWEEVLRFEDPEKDYTIRSISDGIVIARNFKEYDRNGMDPDIDLWIKRFDGSTVYKGKLPMEWLDQMEKTRTLECAELVCGNERELFCIFEATQRNARRANEPQSYVLVKYEITEEGLKEIFLGMTYHEITSG